MKYKLFACGHRDCYAVIEAEGEVTLIRGICECRETVFEMSLNVDV